MPVDVTTERRFEEDIEAFFLTKQGGYTKTTDTYDPAVGLYVDTLINFIKATQPREWTHFENTCQSDNTPLYLYYYLHSFDLCKGFYGMGAGVRQGLNWEGLKLLKIALPPLTNKKK